MKMLCRYINLQYCMAAIRRVKGFSVALILISFLLSSSPAKAQYYSGANLAFGKSRVQFYSDKFVWSYYRFNRFDTYFYTGGRNLAEYAGRYAQVQLPAIERFF